MKKGIVKIVSIIMLVLIGLSFLFGCSSNNESNLIQDDCSDENPIITEEIVYSKKSTSEYNEGVVLVKANEFNESLLGELKYESVEQLFKNSLWYEVKLSDNSATEEAVSYLLELGNFDKVDYDYVMGSDGDIVDISSNPYSTEQGYLDTQGIFDGWNYQVANSSTLGGSPDVVVAIIDTGVDYNHLDLRNNIWTNSGEIPNNGIDDDGNGYVDDYYGWDCVGNDNDPIDDNGHGTHVAGIVAAENNLIGTVGVAFNCKIMCLKAGNSSGYFNNSDIAEAIQYAYMNGASVINMSFGGSSISLAVKEALEDAYNQCVLVAAAGNNGLCNNLSHAFLHPVGVSYPAALPYVIGVMSTNAAGTIISPFSNYDDTPYNNIEYEVYACGEQVPSTWPNNKIARLSGTSMACPVIAGIAALLRSNFSDREIYSNKFIQSQIVNTASINPFNDLLRCNDMYHSFSNAYDALTRTPKPNVTLYDYYVFDNVEYGPKNNGNGVVEAGEIIHIALELYNRGGVASNVTATIDTIRNNDPNLTDPYFIIENGQIMMNDIGTYSIRDCGKIYNEGSIIGTTIFFEIQVLEDCPNDYLCCFNLCIEFNNGLDNNDLTNYIYNGSFTISASNGIILPAVINESTTFDSSHKYIVSNDVIIPSGVEVIFEAGAELLFYGNDQDYYDSLYNSPRIYIYGSLIFNGSIDRMINISSSELFEDYVCIFFTYSNSTLTFNYCNLKDVVVELSGGDRHNNYIADVNNCYMTYLNKCTYFFEGKRQTHYGVNYYKAITNSKIFFDSMYDNYDEFANIYVMNFSNNYLSVKASESRQVITCRKSFCNNVVDGYKGQIDFTSQSSTIIIKNNAFINKYPTRHSADLTSLDLWQSGSFDASNNQFYGAYKQLWPSIVSNNSTSDGTFMITDDGVEDIALLWLFVEDISIYNNSQEKVEAIDNGENKVTIKFNREVDTDKELSVAYGTVYPYSDYIISGDYVDEKTWEGTFKVKSFIESGTQFFRISGANAKNNEFMDLQQKCNNYSFVYDNSSTLSMNLQAYASNVGIDLEWAQDDYDTLMGYNVYRSTEKDGYFTKLNNAVIPAGENTFIDENAEPGVTYWYTFTVVFSDMTESAPAGKVSCTAADTIAPSIYHTPVNQGYLGNNLVISCTASDNIGVASVTLYYRTKGTDTWKTLSMSRQNSRYSAAVFGSDLSLEGLEYYIVASDGYNTISKGTAENPYSVIVKDSSSISRLGDVDGDGVITTKDALMIMQSINGDLLLTDDQFRRADLNNDGILSSVEALRILQYINGNVSTLGM